MSFNHTKLPRTIKKIHKQHLDAICKIIIWLESIGCNTRFYFHGDKEELRNTVKRLTSFRINVYHDNDMVEVGPLTDDPEGQLFFVDTLFGLEVEFDPDKLKYITGEIERFSRAGDPKMKNIHTDFFHWQRKIGLATLCPVNNLKLTYKLEFKVSHGWGTTYKKGQKQEISGYID